MAMPSAVLEKIRSDDLRNEAVAEASEPHTVIVELNLPMPQLEMAPSIGIAARGKPRFRFGSAESDSDHGYQIAASKADIATITGKSPINYLASAGSFVVTANGAQIGRIACMSSVSAIWPNSQHRR